MTAVKMAFGYGLPRSSNVGWFCSLASYSAETTTPHAVAVSPMWAAASSGLSVAATVGKAQKPNTAAAASRFIGRGGLLADRRGHERIWPLAAWKAPSQIPDRFYYYHRSK